MTEMETQPSDFIRDIVAADLKAGKNDGRVITRFPPEPNGYLHIGHAKSICLNFGIAAAVRRGLQPALRRHQPQQGRRRSTSTPSWRTCAGWASTGRTASIYASDYFEQLYDYAVHLIREGKAYVCDLTRGGDPRIPGHPHRAGQGEPLPRPPRGGEPGPVPAHAGRRVPGRRPDPAGQDRHGLAQHQPARPGHLPHPPRRAPPHRATPGASTPCTTTPTPSRTPSRASPTPSAPWSSRTTGRSTTGSWTTCAVPCHPQQIEFARLNLTYTVMSKRKLLKLVKEGHVAGWDDPRMPTIAGLRRRGYTPEAIRDFCDRIGVAKRDSMVDVALLEHCIREDLNKRAPAGHGGAAAPEGGHRQLSRGPGRGAGRGQQPRGPGRRDPRQVPFSRELYIEQDDFLEDPPKKFFRLAPGRRCGCATPTSSRCDEVVKDAAGEVVELRCTYDPETRAATPRTAAR